MWKTLSKIKLGKCWAEGRKRLFDTLWTASRKKLKVGEFDFSLWEVKNTLVFIELLTYPKSLGGLGFRDLCHFNIALLSKQCWRTILQPNYLLAQVLKARYYPYGDFMSSQLGAYPSYICRSLWSAKGLIEKGFGWRIGTGE
ncbi:Polynucleotidyl transferase, Ribonuclease H fold [Gossypium australe]|uniref:Polynucleotidyl transferase, Ribonuclease H fold n=1 Tax=Gossypium australe TaxID=47621 RepID=A0A5B6VAZ5_9ROSI|nr:Polynucleotidyl transferase, Ribonuclease H fold [Gossypium australe]